MDVGHTVSPITNILFYAFMLQITKTPKYVCAMLL